MLKQAFRLLLQLTIAIFLLLIISCKPTGHHERKEAQGVPGGLKLLTEIPLPEVKGGFDLMAGDVSGHRLFISAEDNHSVEVIDLLHNRLSVSVPNLDEPKWVVYRPELRSLFVATGSDGMVTILDDSSFISRHTFTFKEKCNNLRYDTETGQLFVGVGKTFGAIGIIDAIQNKIDQIIPLSAYPKQFELTVNFIYVNVPEKSSVQVINRTAKKVVANWVVTKGNDNVPMALDRNHGRLFIGCQKGELLVYDIASGKEVTRLAIHRDADGIYYDGKRSRIYISCGEGYVEIINQQDADHYSRLEAMATIEGAATSLYSPEFDKLFLPIPQKGKRKAAIRIYQPY